MEILSEELIAGGRRTPVALSDVVEKAFERTFLELGGTVNVRLLAVPCDLVVAVPIRYSRGFDIKDVTPEQREANTFSDFVSALLADRSEDKGPHYVCGPLHGPRGADQAAPRRWLSLDCDGGLLPEAFAALPGLLSEDGVSSLIYTTASHLPEAPRCRIIVELDRVASRHELIRASRAMRARIDAMLAILDYTPPKWDACCDRPEQPLFLPPLGAWADRIEGEAVSLVELLREAPAVASAVARGPASGGGMVVGPETIADLRGALAEIPADDRATWVKVGCALRELGEVGRALWQEWSTTSAKWQTGDESEWSTFKSDRTGYQAVFTEAQRRGWRNPLQNTPRVPRASGLVSVSVDGFERDVEVPAQFVVASLVPAGVVTLLSGHGGAGKTMFALTLAAHVAAGRPWGLHQVAQGHVVFASLEDSAQRIRGQLARIVAEYSLDPVEVSRNFTILEPAPDAGGELVVEDRRTGSVTELPALTDLRDAVKPGIGLVVIDNASDAFDGNENDRRQVRAFQRALARIGRETGKGVLLLAHIDKSAARHGAQGDSYSGSTAWHNSARSRLALTPEKDGTVELRQEKLNLGPKAEPMRLRWSERGVLIPAAGEVTCPRS